MNFIFSGIIGYGLTGGSIVVDKILLNKSLPNPFLYVFYISILGFLGLFFLPFGIILTGQSLFFNVTSGIFFALSLLVLFESLRRGEASVAGPVVGALNPLFTLLIATFLLNQSLSVNQSIAFSIIMLGTVILTLNLVSKHIAFNKQLGLMILAGLLFAISYLLQKQGFEVSNFLSGIVISRIGAAIFVLFFLISPIFRKQIFIKQTPTKSFSLGKTTLLLIFGQTMGALSALFIGFGVSLGNPALVNSLFGVQYLVILVAALILAKKHPELLDETLTKAVLFQKILGAIILSIGVYMLAT
jgi:drug/metabolite transporter (DMT)-like permease